ncbi:MAG TPA: hypothetical protein VI197_32695 [Polyangiaceae bacterium]
MIHHTSFLTSYEFVFIALPATGGASQPQRRQERQAHAKEYIFCRSQIAALGFMNRPALRCNLNLSPMCPARNVTYPLGCTLIDTCTERNSAVERACSLLAIDEQKKKELKPWRAGVFGALAVLFTPQVGRQFR